MKRVLIVDDAAFIRVSLKNILEQNGFEVVGEAANGHEAVEQYKALNPDIVTLDITMPEMTGLEALEIIRSYDKDARVVMLSAVGQETHIVKAINLGAKAFIVKPWKEDYVIETLKKVK